MHHACLDAFLGQAASFVIISSHAEMLCRMQIVYVGDGNNITHSWLRLAARLPFEFVCACPQGFEPDAATMKLVQDSGAGTAVISHDAMDVSYSETCVN